MLYSHAAYSALSPVKNAQSESACARSKCLRPRITQIVKSPEMYVVEGFVGAMRKIVGGRRTQLLYLVKWHGCVHFTCEYGFFLGC
jgi:hypothetical protein